MKRRVWALVGSLTLAVGAPATRAGRLVAHAAGTVAAERSATDTRISGDALRRIHQDIEESEYDITRDDLSGPDGSERARLTDWQAPNRLHGYRTFFTPEGIRVVPRDLAAEGGKPSAWTWGLRLAAYGGTPVAPAELSVSDNRIDYRRSDVGESYVNGARGLEQGFILNAPPAGSSSRTATTLEMAVAGELAARVSDRGRVVEFFTAAGVRVVRYDGLRVQDAAGRDVPAMMTMGDRTLVLTYAAVTAYPLRIILLASRPDWSVEPVQRGARFGFKVASAGDVDGDGYDDVIVGAPFYDSGQVDEGRVWVYRGSASGVTTPAAFSPDSDQAGAKYGTAVGTAGDVNGDGYDDVIVGASDYDKGQLDEGRVWVYHGSSSGLVATAAFRAEGDQAGAGFGWGAATAGDVNGDGYSDVVVGAPGYHGALPNAGQVSVYHGSASGLMAAPSAIAMGSQSGSLYGFAVAGAGDVNGDGYDDVIVAAPFFDDGEVNEGRVWVHHGSALGMSLAGFTADSDQSGAWYGWSVASAGDVNGDGYGDVIVGAPAYDNGQSGEGQVWVYHGSASGLVPLAAFRSDSDQPGAFYGWAVASAGDMNGDGYGDVIVGAPGFNNGEPEEGQVWAYHGSASGLIPLAAFRAEGQQAEADFGVSVASAGDVNGDGYDDLIVGASHWDNGPYPDSGRVEVFYGPF